MSSLRRARSASVTSRCSRRFFSRITCCERCGFDHRFGSADCFSISASCGRTFSASKILPKFVDLLAEFFVFQHQLLIHEDESTLLTSLGYESWKKQSASAALLWKLSHTHTRTSHRAAYRTWLRK